MLFVHLYVHCICSLFLWGEKEKNYRRGFVSRACILFFIKLLLANRMAHPFAILPFKDLRKISGLPLVSNVSRTLCVFYNQFLFLVLLLFIYTIFFSFINRNLCAGFWLPNFCDYVVLFTCMRRSPLPWLPTAGIFSLVLSHYDTVLVNRYSSLFSTTPKVCLPLDCLCVCVIFQYVLWEYLCCTPPQLYDNLQKYI